MLLFRFRERLSWIDNVLIYDAIMSTLASQIISLTIVYSNVFSGADQREHQSSASLAFVREIHRWSVNSPDKGPVTRQIIPFDNVIMKFSGQASFPCCLSRGSLDPLFHRDIIIELFAIRLVQHRCLMKYITNFVSMYITSVWLLS